MAPLAVSTYRDTCDNPHYRTACDTAPIRGNVPPHSPPRWGRPMPDDPAPRIRAGRFYTEAEIAAAAAAAVKRADPKPKGPTQQRLAAMFGVPQSLVSQAFRYDREANRNRGHDLRRRILRALGGGGSDVRFAGPFWLAVGPDNDPADRFAAGEDAYPHGDGTPLPDLDAAPGPDEPRADR